MEESSTLGRTEMTALGLTLCFGLLYMAITTAFSGSAAPADAQETPPILSESSAVPTAAATVERPSIATILSTMHPKTETMDATEKGKNQSRALYIAKYFKIAVAEQQKYGIPASISLAQGMLESDAGNSPLAKKNNNHFGIKCFSTRCGKGHCSNFDDDSHKDFFRKFQTPWYSWRAHSQMLSTGRYATLKKQGNNYKSWAVGLQEKGYATDNKYAEKLIRIIELYELDKLDKL